MKSFAESTVVISGGSSYLARALVKTLTA